MRGKQKKKGKKKEVAFKVANKYPAGNVKHLPVNPGGMPNETKVPRPSPVWGSRVGTAGFVMAVSGIIEPEQDGRAGSTRGGNIKQERGRQSTLLFLHLTAGQRVCPF